jgi:hypothetical protein
MKITTESHIGQRVTVVQGGQPHMQGRSPHGARQYLRAVAGEPVKDSLERANPARSGRLPGILKGL